MAELTEYVARLHTCGFGVDSISMFDLDIKVGWALLLTLFSILTMVGSLYLAFKLLVGIPADYFQNPEKPTIASDDKSKSVPCKIVRNALGCILVAAGIAMLVLPGQGLLTIFAGLLIMDFPGKYRIERRMGTIPGLLKVVNAVRRKAGHDPLHIP